MARSPGWSGEAGLSPFPLGFPFALAVALACCELPPKLLRYALAPLVLTLIGMAAQVLFVAVWGAAIWNVATPTVQRMAHEADRQLFPGHFWHLQLLLGLLWMALLTGGVFVRLGRVLLAMRGRGGSCA
jgi:hypothetical protein